MSTLAGRATPQGTRRGADSFGAGARTLGRTGLTVSPVGFGGYRVGDRPLHRRALADALRGGANLIDTSTNYTGGDSERLVGTTLAHLVQQGEIKREQVVVVSKIGYAQGADLEALRTLEPAQPEVVEYGPNLWHCIHPAFIERQLEASVERLGLEHLDVLLLHNPEYFLSHAHAQGLEGAQEAFGARLHAAFEMLESLVQRGRIGAYGVSSNGFGLPAAEPSSTSLSRMLTIAEAVAGEGHHFGVAQLPVNLMELGGVLGEDEASTLQVAARHDVGVLANRPLNAFIRQEGKARLMRLADAPASARGTSEAVREVLSRVRKLEAAWATGLGKKLKVGEEDDAVDLFRWGQELSPRLEALSLEQWLKLRHEVVAEHIGRTSAALLQALEGETKQVFADWWTQYGTAMHEAFEAIEAWLRGRRHDVAQNIAAALDPCLPAPWRDLPLSRKAVLTVLAAEVSCVLVGMRQPGYVHDILALRDQPIRLLSAGAGPLDFSAVRDAMATLV